MIVEFEHLSEEESDLLFMVPVWVSILLAGADGKIDQKELKGAANLAKQKEIEGEEILGNYFTTVARTFETDMKGYIALLPKDIEARNELIIAKLQKINDIFPKLDRKFAVELYKCYRDFALNVAEASGGIFGMFPISEKEGEFLKLEMIRDPSKSY